jgi:hypothetical protein
MYRQGQTRLYQDGFTTPGVLYRMKINLADEHNLIFRKHVLIL